MSGKVTWYLWHRQGYGAFGILGKVGKHAAARRKLGGGGGVRSVVGRVQMSVLVRRLPLAAYALCPAWSPKVLRAAQSLTYVAVRAPAWP